MIIDFSLVGMNTPRFVEVIQYFIIKVWSGGWRGRGSGGSLTLETLGKGSWAIGSDSMEGEVTDVEVVTGVVEGYENA